MPKPHDDPPVRLSPAMRHYLEFGCWATPATTEEEKFELFMLSHRVLRGDLEPLTLLWQEHAATVKATHRGETFTEAALAGEIPWRVGNTAVISWEPFGRMCCPTHPVDHFTPHQEEQRDAN
jgi:hypothetical protein